MKSKKIVSLLLLAIMCVGVISCDIFEERDKTYQGDSKVEFFPLQTVASESQVVGVNAQLIGKQRSDPLTVNFSRLDTSANTAVAGQDYALGANSVTIPADSSTATFAVQVDNSNLEVGERRDVFIRIDGTSDNNVKPAFNLRTYHLIIRKTPQ